MPSVAESASVPGLETGVAGHAVSIVLAVAQDRVEDGGRARYQRSELDAPPHTPLVEGPDRR